MAPPLTLEWPKAGGCGGTTWTHVPPPQAPLSVALSVTHLLINNPPQQAVAEVSKGHRTVSESASQSGAAHPWAWRRHPRIPLGLADLLPGQVPLRAGGWRPQCLTEAPLHGPLVCPHTWRGLPVAW